MTSLTKQHKFRQPPAKVFDAFANPKAIAQWIAPAVEIITEVTEFAFHPEGRYRYVFTLPDQSQIAVSGQFLKITQPTHLTFTWMWEEPDIHANIETHVAVTLKPDGTGTALTLTHTNLTGADMSPRHASGWDGSLLRLQTLLDISKE